MYRECDLLTTPTIISLYCALQLHALYTIQALNMHFEKEKTVLVLMGSQIKELLTKMYAISFLLSHDDANGFYGYFYYPN